MAFLLCDGPLGVASRLLSVGDWHFYKKKKSSLAAGMQAASGIQAPSRSSQGMSSVAMAGSDMTRAVALSPCNR